jgi:tetratricopeptide (TPR) repeat protein
MGKLRDSGCPNLCDGQPGGAPVPSSARKDAMSQNYDPALERLLQQAPRVLAEGASSEMLAMLEAARRRHPYHAGVALRLADALQLAGRRGDAVAAYTSALALDAMSFEAWYGLAGAHLANGAYAAARDAAVQALGLVPAAEGVRCLLAEALFNLGEVDGAAAAYRRVIGRGDGAARDSALASLAVLIPGSPLADHDAVRSVRSAWIGRAGGAIRPLPARATTRVGSAARRIRVGYMSAFFGSRNWMKPVFGVINRHDRTRFEVHLISDGDDPAAQAGYAEHDQDHVWQVRGMPNGDLARAIAKAEIDVLVDLNGYSLPGRLGVFPYRPAPFQVGWFNMFATTAVPGMDALVGDEAAIPKEEEGFYSERILRVPGTYLAFQVPYSTPDVTGLPWLENGAPTLGCLGSAYKLTPQTIEAWAAILRAVPAARLRVRNGVLDEKSNRSELLRRLERRGVAGERVSMSGKAEHYDFLREYGHIDIALDSFPYNGGTTTTEALWQGVPVLTTNGDRWAGRTSRSLLLAAGLGEWVADDMAAFVARGIALLTDPATPGRLAALRAGMRARLAASPACDSAGLCARLETIYTAGLAGA